MESFTKIQKILNVKGAKRGHEVVTIHYYVQQEGNDVVKLVKYIDRNEIHLLKESQGSYYLKENIPVENIDAGLQWLKDKGYKVVNIVKMDNTDYEYKDGIVGLYIIDDFLYSVILDFREGQHEEMEREFELQTAEIIYVPYNKYVDQIGRLQSRKL